MGIPGHAADRLPELDPEATAELLDVLGDLPVWQLVPGRWQRISHLLDKIAVALETSDVGAVREATAELELASPVRVHRIGASELIPIPEPIRDRANHLVHALRTGEEQPPTPESVDPPEPGGGEGGRRHHG